MPWKTATKIELSEKEKDILTKMSTGTHAPMHFKMRAKIVLYASRGYNNNEIEETMGISSKTVNRWRDRYSAMNEEIRRAEAETPHKMRGAIEKILSDEQRPGGPPTFTDEQVAAIIALSCEDPSKFDLPFSHWTPQLLQIEAIKLGIVGGISVRQIERFLKR